MIAYSFFGLYIIAIILLYLSTSKTRTLTMNVIACSTCGVYIYLTGSHAGVIACIAAALGSLFQLYAQRYLHSLSTKRLLFIKSVGCILFTVIGIWAVYQSPSDYYLVVAIIACRGGEILPREHQVKLGYVFAEVLWMHYAADRLLIPLYSVHLCMTILGLIVIIRHYMKELRQVPLNINNESVLS
ncbi:MAG: hypothetical protein ACRBCK_04865 [Alphaproteobacteria bacterium]